MNSSRAWRHSVAVFTAAASIVTLAEAIPAVASGSAAFVHHADMRDWLADGEQGVWIEAGNGRWFYARFAGVCHGVNSTNAVAFDTPATDNIDQRSAVIVPGGMRCRFQSFAPSDGPPKNRNADLLLQPQSQ
jgi:hypothetical protein